MIEAAKKIVQEFEENIPPLFDEANYSEKSEQVMLYLAAKAYLERYE